MFEQLNGPVDQLEIQWTYTVSKIAVTFVLSTAKVHLLYTTTRRRRLFCVLVRAVVQSLLPVCSLKLDTQNKRNGEHHGAELDALADKSPGLHLFLRALFVPSSYT